MRKRPLLLFACVFLTGLVYHRYSLKQLIVVVLLLVVWECWKGRQSKKFWKVAGRSIVLLSAFLIGVFHMQKEMNFRDAYMSKIEDGNRITVWGKLIKLETMEYENRGILSDCYIDFGEGVMPCNDIMVYTSNDQYQIGQVHKITGKVNMFSKARNEGNFDSFVYYQSLKIDFAIEEELDMVLGMGQKTIEDVLLSLKRGISEVYDEFLSEKTAGFYRAMILGDKTNLEESLKDLFLIGGISHILAISGLHVSMIGRGLYRIMRGSGIGFGISGFCAGCILIFYSIMVGSSMSTVRAVGMMLFFFLAQYWGRSYDMLNALGGMVLFLLWKNPYLIENTGFWFSVTALIGTGTLGKVLSLKKKIGIMSSLGVSIGITLFTLPVTAVSYYEVPVYSPFVNLVVLPLLTPVFCLALGGGVLGLAFPSVGVWKIVLQPCEWLLAFYEWICSWVAALSNSNVICGKPVWWQICLYYFILLGGVYWIRSLTEKQEKQRRIVLAIIIVLCSLCIFFPKSKNFEITFLDVGQGDAVYISAGDGTCYFIDGGSSNVNSVGEYRILPFLKAKDVDYIDYWFVSHCDMDHISGLVEILEKGYKIKHIVLHEQSSITEKQNELVRLAEEKAVKLIYMKEGDRICSKNIQIVCVAPLVKESNYDTADENESSLVLQVDWNLKKEGTKGKALFAGDITSEVEELLCQAGVVEDVDLFKANHHGSNYSNSLLFLERIQPEYIVVSCSATNRYGHPGKAAVERMKDCGAQIFYTMDGGQITFPLIQ